MVVGTDVVEDKTSDRNFLRTFAISKVFQSRSFSHSGPRTARQKKEKDNHRTLSQWYSTATRVRRVSA